MYTKRDKTDYKQIINQLKNITPSSIIFDGQVIFNSSCKNKQLKQKGVKP